MEIENNKVVTLHYTVKDDKGEIFDQSNDGNFVYLHGVTPMIPGLATTLFGQSTGDELTVSVAAEEGYGLRDEARVQEIPKSAFPDDANIQIGMELQAEDGENETLVLTVTKIEDDTITVDSNHPLAGIPLTIDVKVIDVRDASEEELEHGHAHGPNGH